MKRLMTATTAIAALTAGAAMATTDISAVDMDADGFASVAEVKAAYPDFEIEFFEQIDANGDNRVSPEEMLATETQDILARYDMVPVEERPQMIVVDADMDGFMTLDEIRRAFPELTEVEFEQIDLNNDERVTYQEYYTTEAQDIMARYWAGTVTDIAEIDTDGDNFASFDEMVAVYPGLGQENFELIDLNDDNRISSQELYETEAQNIVSRYGS